MSELTRCNHCSLIIIKREANDTCAIVKMINNSEYGGVDIYVVPKGEHLNTTINTKTGNHVSDQWKCWMMEISDRCVC